MKSNACASIVLGGILSFLLQSNINIEARLPPTGIPFSEIAVGDFPPLDCNSQLNVTDCTSFVAEEFDYNYLILIPCGKCLIFDEPQNTTVELLGGLDVEGKLLFPQNYKGTIMSPFIIVQGEFEASSTEMVAEGNIDGLKIILTGTIDEPFYPHAQNAPSCRNKFCVIGKKTFAVAGGKLNLNGMDNTCPTWGHLVDVVMSDEDVTADEFPRLPVPPDGCSRLILEDDFESGSSGLYKSSLGCMDELKTESNIVDGVPTSNNFFHVYGRTREWQGPFVNFGKFLRDCMMPEQMYLFRAKYRLLHEDYIDGKTSNCHNNGTDCLALTLHTMDAEKKLNWRTLYETPAVAKSVDGEWTSIYAQFEFKADDFDPSSLYQMLYLAGPEPGINIDIDEVYLSLPWEAQFPNPVEPVCANLLTNGDAELDDFFPYPFRLNGNLGSHLSIVSENVNNTKNNYFSITGRSAGWTSITQDIIKDCIVQNSVYTFRLRVRLHSYEERTVRFTMKTYKQDVEAVPNFIIESVGNCPPASIYTGWVQCERNFLFQKVHESALKIDVQLIVEDDLYADIDYDDFEIVMYSPPVTKLVMRPEITKCWGIGADIVQSSHTLKPDDYNLLKITNITLNDEGNAVISVDKEIAKPTTIQDDPRFAVEVALLSRNILVTGADDDPANPLHGANLMIIHSPGVKQFIQGVEFRNMGQQGNVGRYPVHFHMCENIDGTVVSRNTVRDSFQRCYVIHATHNVTMEYNVAFNTFGHCYMLEDGFEQENKLFYNIGLGTKITPDEGVLSIAESDMIPATFWVSNPKNDFLGNVAAGSEDTGFWYEFLEILRGTSQKFDPYYELNPSTFDFGYHKDNVMHSNTGTGFKLYPNGYFPLERAVFEGVMSFRNSGDGVLLHNSKNLGVDKSVLADNRRQVDVDKQSDDVTVTNSVIIGFSPLYQFEVEAGNRKSHCPAYRPLVGIQLHSFLRFRDSKGYQIANITFEDFGEDIGCVGSAAIEMDQQVRDGHFDAYTSLYNMTFPEGMPIKEKFNMCELEANPKFLHDLYLQDKSGDLNPAGTKIPGYVVSNSSIMTGFHDQCVDMEGSCSLYCESEYVCFHTINFAVWNTPDYDDLVLEVKDTDSGRKVDFKGYFETIYKPSAGGEIPDDYENYVYQRRRYYSAVMPHGKYALTFRLNGLPYWPQLVETVWEDPPDCSPHIDRNTTTLVIPTLGDNDCENIVRNPGGEDGGFNFWGHSGGGITVIEGNEADKTTYKGSFALSSGDRKGSWHGIGQYLDTRCFTEGRQYEIIIKIRMYDIINKKYITCNINRYNFNAYDVCPRVTFRIRRLLGDKIGDGVDTSYAYPMANALGPWHAEEWNTIYGMFTVTETMAKADSIFMFVERGRAGVNFHIDDVQIQPTYYGCQMPVYNTNFESGDTRFWRTIGTTEIDITNEGFNNTYALKTTMRKEWWGSMSQDLNKDCLVQDNDYSVSALVKLLNEDGSVYDCTAGLQWGVDGMDFVCPVMSLRITVGNSKTDIDIGGMPGPLKAGDFNSIFGQFTVSEEIMNADTVSVYFRKVKAGIHIVLDNIDITPIISQDADQKINNGDFATGDARFFNIQIGGSIDVVSEPGKEGEYALIVNQRTNPKHGVRHAIDNTGLIMNELYKITCRVSLLYEDLTVFFKCDPRQTYGDETCPFLSLRSQNSGSPPLKRVIASAPSNWVFGEWNTFSGVFEFLAAEIEADSLYLIIDGAPPGVAMIIDDIELRVANPKSKAPTVGPTTSPTTSSPSFNPTATPTKECGT